jgi:DegV family protein with EDD domain
MSIAIVTDSSARFVQAGLAHQYSIYVLPNTVEIGDHRWLEEADFVLDELLRLMAETRLMPRVIAPSAEAYAALYRQLVERHRAIVSIHPSRELSRSFENARAAALRVQVTSCPIVVLDSRTICAGQGVIVRLAAELAQRDLPLHDLLDAVRSALERVYSLYYVETLEYLRQSAIIADSRAILGSLLGIKPLLTVEDGRFKVIEKVRTRSQAYDQLVEFLAEFDALEETIISQARSGAWEQARAVQERFSHEWKDLSVNFTTHCAAMIALLGAEAGGIVVLEREYTYDDEFSED